LQTLHVILTNFAAWKALADVAIVTTHSPTLQEARARKLQMDQIREEFSIFLGREREIKISRSVILSRTSALAVYFGIGLIGILLVALSVMTRILFKRTVRDYNLREDLLVLEREKSDAILKCIGDAVLVVDPQSKVQFLNEIAENLTEWKLADAKGRPVDEVFNIINQNSRLTVENPVGQVLAKGIIVGLANHTLLIGKNGQETPIEDSAAPIRLRPGESVRGVILVFRDVSQRHLAEDLNEENQRRLEDNEVMLKRLVETSRSATDAKSAFLSNMSHEIRTPLGAIIGFANLLKDPKRKEAERVRYTETIRRNAQQLHDIVDDILDLSKVESGIIQYEIRDCDLRVQIEDTVALLMVKAQEKGIGLEVEFAKDIPHVMTDTTRFKQIMMNVVGNAIKFTENGKVKIYLEFEFLGNSQLDVKIRVSDTGIGISASQRDQLFKTFSQADVSTTRKFGGSGLGLALSKTFAKGLGGDLSLESSVSGVGSTFLVTLKLPLAVQIGASEVVVPSTKTIPSDLLKGLRLLLVEDSLDNQYLIEKFLKSKGASVDLAVNGAEAVQFAIRGNHDLILMDISMPVMDGYAATHRLREQGYTKPIIALTAHATAEVRLKCLKVGCNDHLTKPVDERSLYLTVARFTRPGDRSIAEPAFEITS
jgi:PAS domain S-box-containing protein